MFVPREKMSQFLMARALTYFLTFIELLLTCFVVIFEKEIYIVMTLKSINFHLLHYF